jgi:putative SOS response-associated peptidase YedK
VCGRFTVKATWAELIALYRLTMNAPPHNLRPRYNVCPTDPVDVVTAEEGKRELAPMRWGLVPRWWSKPLKELRVATFNARAETVETKPVFRDAFKRTRCLIPVSGYYEWQNTPSGKQPWYFTARDGSPLLTAAGLWDEWSDNRRAAKVLHDDHHRAERLRGRSARSDAGLVDRRPVLAVAERGGGSWNSKARAERLFATLACVEAGQ